MKMRKELIWAVLIVSLLAVIPVKATPDPGLVGKWHFDTVTQPDLYPDPSYPKWTPDSSGYDHTAYLYPIGSEPTLVPGKFGNALSFDGTNYAMVDRTAALEPTHISVEVWIKRSGYPGGYKYILAKRYGSGWASYGLYTYGWGIAFYIGGYIGATGHFTRSNTGSGVWDGEWHHVVGTFDGSYVRLYVDGSEVGSGVFTTRTIAYNTNNLYMGWGGIGGSEYRFSGSMDEVRIWDFALSASQVAASYNLRHGTEIRQEDLNGDGYPDVIFTSAFYLGRQDAGWWTDITITILPVNPSVVVGYDIDGDGGVEPDEYVVLNRATPKGTNVGQIVYQSHTSYSVTVRVTQGDPPCNSVHLWLYLSTGDHLGVNVQFLPYG